MKNDCSSAPSIVPDKYYNHFIRIATTKSNLWHIIAKMKGRAN